MKFLALFAGCLLSGSVVACTYDKANQLTKLRELAKSNSGYLNEAAQEVTWKGAIGEKYSVFYGGCTHLGHQITVTNLLNKLPSEPELFAITQKLADDLWWNGEGELLKRALKRGEFTRNVSPGNARFDILGTDYSEMYVEYRKEAGAVVVALGWNRSF